ncbi:BBE domain-containing protein [Salinigranum sp. GCM10025319]|uniref:BBE domain-containing protein n=1 Tax=Salinigranum sp. GCM10025319 TaxID=3252687 RepID=UPI003611098B
MHEAMTPYATGGVYPNFVLEEVGDGQTAYRENYDRLVEMKNAGESGNLLRLNHNVEPTKYASRRITSRISLPGSVDITKVRHVLVRLLTTGRVLVIRCNLTGPVRALPAVSLI